MAKRVVTLKSTSPEQSLTVYDAREAKTVAWQTVFIEHLQESGHVTNSCAAAGVSRSIAYLHRKTDEAFAARWDEALQVAVISLEDEAWRRARDGVEEPIVSQGFIIGSQQRYSDTLMTLLLKANRPEKYADRLRIEIKSEHLELLKKLGIESASSAWQAYMDEVAKKVAEMQSAEANS